MTAAVASTEFCRNFGDYQRRVQREPIEVRSHGKTTGYFVSVEDFERMRRVIDASRKAYHPSELPAAMKAAVEAARMRPEHEHLNALMDDEG